MSEVFCPASFCPLIAKDGSPWTGTYKNKCPQHDNLETDGCPWWSMACESQVPHRMAVLESVAAEGKAVVLGPNRPRESGLKKPTTYDCKHVHECSWQIQAKDKLCPPRYALSKGADPRVVLF